MQHVGSLVGFCLREAMPLACSPPRQPPLSRNPRANPRARRSEAPAGSTIGADAHCAEERLQTRGSNCLATQPRAGRRRGAAAGPSVRYVLERVEKPVVFARLVEECVGADQLALAAVFRARI